MSMIDDMLKRRSIRRYKKQAVREDDLMQILQAGLLAPTSRNLKPCEFFVVKDREKLKALSQAKKAGAQMLKDADCAIVVSADSDRSDTWIEDCSIALAFMHLMADSLNVGSCWVQFRLRKNKNDEDGEQCVLNILGLEAPFRTVGLLAIGVRDEEKPAYHLDQLDYSRIHNL
ncbi:MAG: nitroreductase family protein [bacterium]